jgi:hypothetical protein
MKISLRSYLLYLMREKKFMETVVTRRKVTAMTGTGIVSVLPGILQAQSKGILLR